ncbi:MAG: hypothetical protein WD066_10430 [Planctomycetaceae bacterium]
MTPSQPLDEPDPMPRQTDPGSPPPAPAGEDEVRELLGYLNFSSGKPDPAFQSRLNRVHASLGEQPPLVELRDLLLSRLAELKQDAAFADSRQAEAVVRLTLDECVPAYRAFHADLLAHAPEQDFEQPFFLARVFEAVLSEGLPWDESDRVVRGAIDRLNDFLGFRPVAVLENDRKMEPYRHERHRPVPLYIRDAGVAAGRYHDLIAAAHALLRMLPEESLRDAHFDPDHLDELALDLRAHDHTHPVNKRTNYMFGEWDPHQIDNRGYYRRFVLRQVILDAMLDWIEHTKKLSYEERLYDAAAVLCGTILMASSISGAGPATHDSNVTLTSLLPYVARQRDAFYARLLAQAKGKRAQRLKREAERTQQPFGHVRQHLNMQLAGYGAQQVQNRFLAQLYARLGYPEAARRQAALIPAPALRFETEIHCLLATAHQHLDRGDVRRALELLRQSRETLLRGIDCGAIVDPWNILGFQGQFPLFSSREDVIPDHRVEVLLELVERLFGLASRALGEASAQGEPAVREETSQTLDGLAEWWDRFATLTVEGLPEVSGAESRDSARAVAEALAGWREAGESAGDISFWRRHVERFESPKAYALVAGALLRRADTVAVMALLIQWLSRGEEVGLESGPHSIHALFGQWMELVTAEADESTWPTLRRLFDFLEANAGVYWQVPDLGEVGGRPASAGGMAALDDSGDLFGEGDDLLDPDEGDDDDDEDELFGAAYEGVVYRDSTDDGNLGDTIDDAGGLPFNTEFELIARQIDPRLRFFETLAESWQRAAVAIAALPVPADDEQSAANADDRGETIRGWIRRCEEFEAGLVRLMNSVWDYESVASGGDHDANVEYDFELQTKFYLLNNIVNTHVGMRTAKWFLLGCLPPFATKADSAEEPLVAATYRAVFRRDVAEVRRLLPQVVAELSHRPLLYVPFDNGGHPRDVLAARLLQSVLRFLLSQLPRLGLLREAWHVLRTAYRMERVSRPQGLAVTEFDRLFRTALTATLREVVISSPGWKSGRFTDEDLVETVGDMVDRYLELWIKQSRTMRLSSVEAFDFEGTFEGLREFVMRYGGDLFHAGMLTLGNVRAILHMGVEEWLDWMIENADPLHPVKLLEDIERGAIDREEAEQYLELVYEVVVDKFDRFLEYNTTTTQSDYGEMFHSLLEFLRLEAEYDREAWNLVPVHLAHEQFAKLGRHQSAAIWEHVLEAETSHMAERFLRDLAELEQRHAMRLPSISDHLQERFVKPLAVNRMLALVPEAAAEAGPDRETSTPFEELRDEIDRYLSNTSGSGIDAPEWLRQLKRAVDRIDASPHEPLPPRGEIEIPEQPLTLREIGDQLRNWRKPLSPRKGKSGNR